MLRMEADVAIQLTRPDRPDQIVTRLGRLHIYPFASRQYAQTYGLPTNLEEMTRHRLVRQTGPQLDASAWPRFGLADVDRIAVVRTNASAAHFYAVELGLGIGALATYALALGADLTPVDMGFKHQADIWMTYHPDVKRVRRVAIFIEWLRSLFDPKRYPWFGDEFIHPSKLKKPDSLARVDISRPVVTRSPHENVFSDPVRLKGRHG